MSIFGTIRLMVWETRREINNWIRTRTVHPVVFRYIELQKGRVQVIVFLIFSKIAPPFIRYRFTTSLIRKTGLFDAEYYLRVNTDVADSGNDPILHYVRYGDHEGRFPIQLFDPRYYRARAGKLSYLINSLLHYVWIGRHRKLSPSAWFDTNYYIQHNRDVERKGIDPLLHYLRWGGLEGRSPNLSFNGSYYLRSYPEVSVERVNPLIHYIERGRFEGRLTRPLNMDSEGFSDSKGISKEVAQIIWQPSEWANLENKVCLRNGAPLVAVVIPVYRDRKLTWRCLASVLTSNCETVFKIIVVDDRSPEPDLSKDLCGMASRGWIELLKNEKNQGFVVSVNLAIQAAGELDIVLLNSDTEVYPGWLDRLRHAAYRHHRTASVTPLSNNATIASYPRFLHDNPYPLEIDYSVIDQLALQCNSGIEVETPTGVGFCMYLRRDAIDEVGLFDEENFGKGYGEENDWCQRAIAVGRRNFIAANIFVRHFGSVSFLGEKAHRVAQAMEVLASKHPSYNQQVQHFIKQDPLRFCRHRLDWARLVNQSKVENVLIVAHNRGGGSERHVQEDTQRLIADGKGVFFLRPVRGNPNYVRFAHHRCRQLLNSPVYSLADTEGLAKAIKRLGITSIHSHGLVDFSPEAPNYLIAISQFINLPLDVDIHDYKVICPRINMVDGNSIYCGEPEEKSCDKCLVTHGNDFGIKNIRAWREMHHQALRFSRRVWVPSNDVAKRLNRYFPDVDLSLSPHENISAGEIELHGISIEKDEKLRIAIIGAIGNIKGYEVLLACAKDARRRSLPLSFMIMGHSIQDASLKSEGVEITGKYMEKDALQTLISIKPHIVFLPSVWPETYSYTLSIALKAGLNVAAFDIGAIAERLQEFGRGQYLIPFNLVSNPQEINRHFLEFRQSFSIN